MIPASGDSKPPEASVFRPLRKEGTDRAVSPGGAVEAMAPLPDVPLAVLTSLKAAEHPEYVTENPEGLTAWRATTGEPGSGHPTEFE